MPLVAVATLKTSERHRHRRDVLRARRTCVLERRVARLRLEQLDAASHVARERHVHADASLANRRARPTGSIVLVDHDRTAHNPHAAAAARRRVVQNRRLRVGPRRHVRRRADAETAVLARQVANLARAEVARDARRREVRVVVAARHRGAALAVDAARCSRWELVHVPLVAIRRAAQRRKVAHDHQVARHRLLVQHQRASWVARRRRELHLDPVRNRRAHPASTRDGFVQHDRAAQRRVLAVQRQCRVEHVALASASKQARHTIETAPLARQIAVLIVVASRPHRVVVAARVRARRRRRHREVVHVPLVAVATLKTSEGHRHRSRVRLAGLEQLDAASHGARKRHAHTDASFANVGARPA